MNATPATSQDESLKEELDEEVGDERRKPVVGVLLGPRDVAQAITNAPPTAMSELPSTVSTIGAAFEVVQ